MQNSGAKRLIPPHRPYVELQIPANNYAIAIFFNYSSLLILTYILPLYNGYRVSFPGGKAAEAKRGPRTTSSAEVKERVELYFTYGLSWPILW